MGQVDFLKDILAKRGWTAAELARRSGLREGSISLILSGKRGIGTRALAKIRKALPRESIYKFLPSEESDAM